MSLNRNQKAFVEAAEEMHGVGAIMTRDMIQSVCDESNQAFPYWLVTKSDYRHARGLYKLPDIGNKVKQIVKEEPALVDMAVIPLRQPKMQDSADVSIPDPFPDYVPFGFFKDLSSVIKSKQFYPVFITGHSGNGKTLMVEQVCATLNRECIRVNISIETDESDLIGGPTLINGNVVYRDGPVVTAMKRGAVLLLDEVDRGSNKLLCLQSILEGKPYFNKKSGELIKPMNGFTIVATANTKGQGSDEGRYLAQILDDAFLERFAVTVEQKYPDAKTEKKILMPLINDEEYVENLVRWADVVRQSYDQGAVGELITTRRLVHIAGAYRIFRDKMKAIELCISRFDEETKTAFLDLYTKVDAKADEKPAETPVEKPDEEIPF